MRAATLSSSLAIVASHSERRVSLPPRISAAYVSIAAFSVGFSASVAACVCSSRWRLRSTALKIRWPDSRLAVTDCLT